MQELVFRALLATSLLSLAPSCASLQSVGPQDPPTEQTEPADTLVSPQVELDTLLLEEDEFDRQLGSEDEPDTLILADEDENGPPIRLDYIDDRLTRPIRQLSIFAGARDFTDDDIWGDVGNEFTLGLEYAHEVNDGLGFEVGGLGSLGTDNGVSGDVDVTGAAAELYGGGRYWFKNEERRWTPYVGVGLSMILAGVDDDAGNQVADDQDFTVGFYAHGGVQYDLNDLLFLGVDLRTLFGTDLDLTTISGDADYWQLGLTVGFRL